MKDTFVTSIDELPFDMRKTQKIHDCYELIVYQKLLTRIYYKKNDTRTNKKRPDTDSGKIQGEESDGSPDVVPTLDVGTGFSEGDYGVREDEVRGEPNE